MKSLTWKTCFRVGVSIFLLYLCISYFSGAINIVSAVVGAASPIIIGAVMAYILNILMSAYEKLYFPKSQKAAAIKTRRPICIILAYLTLIAIISLVVWLIIPRLIDCVEIIIKVAPGAINDSIKNIQTLEFLPQEIRAFVSEFDWNDSVRGATELLASGIGGIMGTVIQTISSVFSGIITAFLAIVFSAYMLANKDELLGGIRKVAKHYINDNWYGKTKYFLHVLNKSFRGYIVGQCVEAVVLGVLCTVGMFIFGFPYATMIGALIAFTALIPIAGAYIGGAVGAFMIMTESPIKAVLFIVFLVILQQLEGNLIYPRVVGVSLGLPGIWVLAAVTIGGGIFGVVGMLLGVPITAAFYRILKHNLKNKSKFKIGDRIEKLRKGQD